MPRWPESCRSCSHLAAPSNKCFCLFTAGSPAAWAPGGFVSSVHTVFSRVLGPEAGAARPALCMGTAMSAPRWPGASSPPQSPFGHAPFNHTLPVECQYKRMLRTQAGRGFLDACPRMGQQAGTERGQPGRVHPLLVSEEASFKRSGTTSSPPAETWASPAPWHRSCVRGCSHPFPLMWILWCVGYSQRPGPHEEGEGARRVHRGTSRHSHNKPRPLSREGSWCGWQGQGHPKPRRRCRGCHGPGEQSRGAASFPASCQGHWVAWGPHDAARGGRCLGLLLGTRSWGVPVPLDSDCVTLRWGQMGSEHIPTWRGWGHPGLGCPVGTCLGKQHLPSQAVIHPSSPSSNKTLWMSQGRGAGTAGLLPARGTSSSR